MSDNIQKPNASFQTDAQERKNLSSNSLLQREKLKRSLQIARSRALEKTDYRLNFSETFKFIH